MRILVVGDVFPWPSVSGGRMRMAKTVEALTSVGNVDFFAFTAPDLHGPFPVPSDVALARVALATKPRPHRSSWTRIRWFADGHLPAAIHARDYSEARRALRAWTLPPYDLVWCKRAETYLAVEGLVPAPMVVDLDDLQDHKLSKRLASSGRTGGWPWSRLQVAVGRRNIQLWHDLQVRIARSVTAVTVCSEIDRDRLGVPNAVVIPNGYDAPRRPAGSRRQPGPPTILLQGNLCYGPNIDAAVWLVREIGPRLRSLIPDVQIRLIGRSDARVGVLHDPPRVIVTGFVPDIGTELARAHIVVAPFRFGGGTRIKILEAFAHEIPVVATAMGVEGLPVRDGEHVLVRDTPEAFAGGCADLLRNRENGRLLAEAGRRLVMERFQWSDVQRWIEELVRRIMDGQFAADRGGQRS